MHQRFALVASTNINSRNSRIQYNQDSHPDLSPIPVNGATRIGYREGRATFYGRKKPHKETTYAACDSVGVKNTEAIIHLLEKG